MAAGFEPAPLDPNEAELIQALSKDLDDVETLQVYADYLLQRGDIRGELISLQFEPPSQGAVDRAAEIQKKLIADLEKESGVSIKSYEFELGLLTGVTLERPTAKGLRTLLGARDGAMIRSLRSAEKRPMEALTEALPLTRVTTLDLTDCEIGVHGARTLAEVLPQTQIRTLDLSGNAIQVEGARALAQALPRSQVTDLNLSLNWIGDQGAMALAQLLPQSQLNSLSLSANQIGTKGTELLARALPQSQVKVLNLGNNEIGDQAVGALAEALPSISSDGTASARQFNQRWWTWGRVESLDEVARRVAIGDVASELQRDRRRCRRVLTQGLPQPSRT
jgi:uncharacterized protein (TIGR02996 family)